MAIAKTALFASGALLMPWSAAVSTLTPVKPLAPQHRIADMESELITITPHGFEPREISRPKGSILLRVENRSGLRDVSIQLNSEAGPNLRALHVPREQPNWDDVIDLEPGRYVITEANHPNWICRITIAAQ